MIKQNKKLILALIAFIIIATSFALREYFKPTFNRLTEIDWCVERIYYNNEYYLPHTLDNYKIVKVGECFEEIVFGEDGRISLPGINSYAGTGKWQLKDSKIIIDSLNETESILYGTFEPEFINDELILTSTKTKIYCIREKRRFNPFE